MATISAKPSLLFEENSPFEKKISFIFIGILVTLFCILCIKGPLFQPDSGGYIANATIRSPLYPLLLKIYHFFFGTKQYQVLIMLQILAGFGASFYTARLLSSVLNVSKNIAYIVMFILLFPYYGPGLFGNNILTESLCYPLFLMTFCYFLKGLFYKNNKWFMSGMALSGLLVLARGQFLFLYPAIAIILGYIFIFERKSFKIFTLLFCFLLTVITANLAERTYQYIYHGQFKQVPFTGIQLIIAPLYLSRASDVQLFKDEKERALFQDIWNIMEEKKINFNSLKTDSYFHMNTYTSFYDNYNKICWESLAGILSKYQLITPYQIDPTLTHMAVILILNNLKGFFTLYLLNIVLNIGGIYFSLLLLATGLLSILSFIKTKHPLALTYLLALLFTAGNYTLIALVEPVLRRYSAYTDTIQTAVLFIGMGIAYQFFRKTMPLSTREEIL